MFLDLGHHDYLVIFLLFSMLFVDVLVLAKLMYVHAITYKYIF